MFKNIGKKIKGLASGICIAGISISVIVGIIIMSFSEYDDGMLLLGIIIMALGSLISWISSFCLYGYGELIDKTSEIARKLYHETGATAPIIKKISLCSTDATIGKCEKCNKTDTEIYNIKIVDDMGTQYKNICSDCITTYGYTVHKPELKERPLETVSVPQDETTKMCLSCGRILPINRAKCFCGFSNFEFCKK